jgi:hypothetical protein
MRALYGCVCLRYLASTLAFGARRPVGAPALVCVCVRETSEDIHEQNQTGAGSRESILDGQTSDHLVQEPSGERGARARTHLVLFVNTGGQTAHSKTCNYGGGGQHSARADATAGRAQPPFDGGSSDCSRLHDPCRPRSPSYPGTMPPASVPHVLPRRCSPSPRLRHCLPCPLTSGTLRYISPAVINDCSYTSEGSSHAWLAACPLTAHTRTAYIHEC